MNGVTVTIVQDVQIGLRPIEKAKTMEHVDQNVASDIKHQDIMYNLQNGSKSVRKAQIDLFKAINEMKSLDWNKDNFITFWNCETSKMVQFIRKKEDYWYAEEVIGGGTGWNGYVWGARSDSKSVFKVVEQFFEEDSWEQTLSWKLNRIRGHYTR